MMKMINVRITVSRYLLSILFVFCLETAYATGPELIEVGASDVYVPLGFDDNDNVEVVIEGMFSDTRYRMGPVTVQHVKEGHKIIITPHAYVRSGPQFQVMVPYENVVSLGVLSSGTYTIEIGTTKLETPPLIVDFLSEEKKKEGPDNFLYAPVKSIVKISDEPLMLRLKGTFTNSCMSLERVEVKPSYHQVVAVLPIAHYETEGPCAQVMTPFTVDVNVPEKLKSEKLKGRYLFHVRSLNGASVNLVEDVY